MPRMLSLVAALGLAASSLSAVPAQAPPRNVILITLDGARHQEIFTGLDPEIVREGLKEHETLEGSALYRKFWAPTAGERRAKVMPFFWNEWMAAHGSIAGNRARGSRVTLTNTMRFSYPGYSEILTGAARDAQIDSNDNRRYPFPTLLDVLQQRLGLSRTQVAAFGSWETFNWIVSNREDAFTANAGYETYDSQDDHVRFLSRSQFETQTGWDTVRNDMYTVRLALAHLKTFRPRVLYLALGETDDWAHGNRYDRVLQTLERTDAWFRELWAWLQRDAQYRDNTTILITVDHGRGRTAKDWPRHGKDIDGAEETWAAFIGPDWPRRGEWAGGPAIHPSQFASTLAKAAGVDLRRDVPEAAAPIDVLWTR
jgi:hypothetical protein